MVICNAMNKAALPQIGPVLYLGLLLDSQPLVEDKVATVARRAFT